MAEPSLHPDIVQALNSGMTVLTAGERAARAIRNRCGDPAGKVYALGTWLQSLWTEMTLTGHAERTLLNAAQQDVLWCQAIRSVQIADAGTAGLRSVESLADLASSAYTTLLLHGGRAALEQHAHTTDSRAFLRWAESFEHLLQQQGACTPAELPGLLTDALARGELPVDDPGLLLVDFDTLLPAQHDLFHALESAGFTVRELGTAISSPTAMLFPAADGETEMHQAAAWLNGQLEQNPEARLALVVPNLAEVRPALERVLLRGLPSAPTSSGDALDALPFECSLGVPLSDRAQVGAAFALLRLAMAPQPLAAISGLLLSPCFGAAGTFEERLVAAEFDAQEVRTSRLLRPELSLNALLRLLERSSRGAKLPRLLHRVSALREAAAAENLGSRTVRQSHARWADSFRAVLQAAGWTESSAHSSLGFQVHQRWESALDELSTLDFDGSRPTANEALAALLRVTQRTVFAPESHAAVVQVMGPLEPGGVPFDGLWFLSAGDLSWPATPSLNPLLPRSLARALGVPGTRAKEDHEQGQRLTRRLAGMAGQAVFSFAVLEDQQHQQSLPALSGLGTVAFEPEPALPAAEPLPLLEIEDTPSQITLPDRVMRGGAGILEHQAACAFRAFAQYRLGSNELLRQDDGFDHGERGNLVHKVMELFWAELADQGELRALTPAKRTELLRHCIERALERNLQAAETAWDHAYLRTQQVRLLHLLEPWLEQELRRPPFAVRVNEQPLEDVALGPLRLKLRVDRIDETEAGDLILDYKTGLADPKEWRSDRPDKPQLPVYAVLAQGMEVSGVAFASLRPGKGMGLRGMAASADLFGGKLAPMDRATFAEQLDRWKAVLTSLAEDFHAGVADVLPKQFPQTCKYCAHRILCRVDPSLMDDAEDDEDAAELVHG